MFVLEPYKARLQRRISIDTTWAFGYIIHCDPSAASMCFHLCFVLRNMITAGKNWSLCSTPNILVQTSGVPFLCQCSDVVLINPLTPNDNYRDRTAPLTSKRFILYIYSTNTGTEYFKNSTYSPSFSLQNAVCFIILTYLVPVLLIFYIQGVLKLKK